MSVFKISAVQNDFSARMRGCTYYSFAALPRPEGGFAAWTRVDQLSGAIITSRAINGINAAARHSSTDVEVDLPDGALIKTVAKGKHDTVIERARDGKLSSDGLRFVGNTKIGDGWATVIEIDGQRVTI